MAAAVRPPRALTAGGGRGGLHPHGALRRLGSAGGRVGGASHPALVAGWPYRRIYGRLLAESHSVACPGHASYRYLPHARGASGCAAGESPVALQDGRVGPPGLGGEMRTPLGGSGSDNGCREDVGPRGPHCHCGSGGANAVPLRRRWALGTRPGFAGRGDGWSWSSTGASAPAPYPRLAAGATALSDRPPSITAPAGVVRPCRARGAVDASQLGAGSRRADRRRRGPRRRAVHRRCRCDHRLHHPVPGVSRDSWRDRRV